MKFSRLPRQLGNQHLVYLETRPAHGEPERLAVTQRALSQVGTSGLSIAPPPQELVESLLAEAEVVLEDLCALPETSMLRDKLLLAIEAFARAEAVIRTAPQGTHNVISNRVPFWLLRPEHPTELARGVRRRLGLNHGRAQLVPWTAATAAHLLVRRAKHARHRASSRKTARVLLITGNASYERAINPVWQMLDRLFVESVIYDESLNTSSNYPGVLSVLPWGRVMSGIANSRGDSLEHLIRVWRDHRWWGNAWFEEAHSVLSGISRYYLTVAELYADAYRTLIDSAKIVITPQSASVQLRALLGVANEAGVPVIVIPHGLYLDNAGWTDLAPTCFAVTGERFARVLRQRGFEGRIELVGATFFEENETPRADVVVALRPIEKASIASREALRSLLVGVIDAVSSLNMELSIAVRPHPRQTVAEIRALMNRAISDDDQKIVLDHSAKGGVLIGPESSIVAHARIEGTPVVLLVEPGMPTMYRFENLPGVFLARGTSEIKNQLTRALGYEDTPESKGTWRLQVANTERGSTDRLSEIILSYIDS